MGEMSYDIKKKCNGDCGVKIVGGTAEVKKGG